VRVAQPGVNLVFALGIAALALTAGLTAACFVKAYGITFLSLPRSETAAQAHEATPAMRWAMAALAGSCAVLGLGATVVVPVLSGVAARALGVPGAPAHATAVTFEVAGGFAALSPALIALALVIGLAVPVAFLVAAGSPRRARPGETWGCGRLLQTARMEYTAAAFADPFKRVFRFFYRPVRRLELDAHPESRFFVRRIEYANPVRALFDEWLYRPLLRGVRGAAGRAQALQSGSAAAYLGYILAVLLALLVLR
jgi:hydrogenase-4 component B